MVGEEKDSFELTLYCDKEYDLVAAIDANYEKRLELPGPTADFTRLK